MSEVSILKLRDGATVVAKVSSEDGEKFLVKASSSSFDLNTLFPAPVTATLVSFFNFY